MEAKLVVVGGSATRSEVKLKLPMTIGRTKEAGLSIAHPMVSRLHCTLYELDGAVVIRDNNSSNGTFINDQKISESVLQPGDKLTVGPLTFVAIYKAPSTLPSLANRGAVPAAGQADLDHDQEDDDLTKFARAAQNLSEGGSAFESLINEIPDVDLQIDSGDEIEVFGPDQEVDFEGGSALEAGEDDDEWGALHGEEDGEEAAQGTDEPGSSATSGGGGDATDLNAFFQDLVDMAGEDSLMADSQDQIEKNDG